MPKATLTFKLPEEGSDLKLAQRGSEYFGIIWDIQKVIREHEKYDKPMKDCWEEIKELAYSAETEDIE